MPRPWDEWVEPDTSGLVLEPIFGCKTFGADTTCADIHPGLIDPETGVRDGRMPSGSNCVCMCCHVSGREKHPALRETATDRLRVQNWKPPEGGDQWSTPTAEPTTYAPPAEPAKPRPQMKQFARKRAVPA